MQTSICETSEDSNEKTTTYYRDTALSNVHGFTVRLKFLTISHSAKVRRHCLKQAFNVDPMYVKNVTHAQVAKLGPGSYAVPSRVFERVD